MPPATRFDIRRKRPNRTTGSAFRARLECQTQSMTVAGRCNYVVRLARGPDHRPAPAGSLKPLVRFRVGGWLCPAPNSSGALTLLRPRIFDIRRRLGKLSVVLRLIQRHPRR